MSKAVTTTKEFHSRAMELFDSALLARQRGDEARSKELLAEALKMETAAADSVAGEYTLEPTRSVLHRSAASLAFQIGDAKTARRYLEAALGGNPPLEILRELRELDHQVTGLERPLHIRSRGSGQRRSPDVTPTKMIIDRFKKNLPVNIVGLAEALGIQVLELNLGRGVAGEIFRDTDSDSGYSINVNTSDPVVRKRFTVGHEIAHYLLHRDRFTDRLRDDSMYRSGLSDSLEQAANRLAADLLMPAKAIRELRAQGINNPEEMSARLGVSLQAMQLRLGIGKGRKG
jgi:Zn-dependent peptidase ImmA (M78 family)